MKKFGFILLLLSASILLVSCGGEKTEAKTSTGSDKTKIDKKEESVASTGNRKGKLVYKQYCVICHGADGKLAVSGATDLSASTLVLEERIEQITNGKGLMTPYKDILSKEQINSVAEYIEELRQ